MTTFSFDRGFGSMMFAYSLFWLIIAIVHLGFAANVAMDVSRNRASGRASFAGGAFLWFLATLIGGVFVVAAYWVITYSTLNPRVTAGLKNESKSE